MSFKGFFAQEGGPPALPRTCGLTPPAGWEMLHCWVSLAIGSSMPLRNALVLAGVVALGASGRMESARVPRRATAVRDARRALPPVVVLRIGGGIRTNARSQDSLLLPVIVDASLAATPVVHVTVWLSWTPNAVNIVSAANQGGHLVIATDSLPRNKVRLDYTDSAGITGARVIALVSARAKGIRSLQIVAVAVDGAAASNPGAVHIWPHFLCEIGNTGDVNGDGAVNIVDAQQLARFIVGLPTSFSTGISILDANGDGTVDIIDAQQVARWAVGLQTAHHLGDEEFEGPKPDGLAITPTSLTLAVNGFQWFDADLTSSHGGDDHGPADVRGCTPVHWSVLDTAVADVDSVGFVTAKAPGRTTVTASVLVGLTTYSANATLQVPAPRAP